MLTPSRKQVTVLFGDVPDYTGLVGKLDAEEVHELMNLLWARLDKIITSHGGIIDKHIGDAIMALFGAKHAREEDPEEAIKAGLEIQACLREFHPGADLPPVRMRLGIHTGQVLLGPVGSRKEFTATGDAVNLASRLEHEAPIGGVLISQGTYRHVCGLFDVQELAPLIIRGKDEPVQAYQVLRAKPRPVALRRRGIEGVERQMVGRQEEMRQLQLGLERVVRERKAMMFTIVAEAGVGKSCLAQEFAKWVEMLPHYYRFFSGRGLPEAVHAPFSLIRNVLCHRFEIQESDPTMVARDKLENGITSFLSSGGQERPPTEVSYIGQLLGIDYSDTNIIRAAQTDPEQLRHRAFHDLGKFFSAVNRGAQLPGETSSSHATLLFLEDIHWGDDGSLDFIEYLARVCQNDPLMIICLARPTLTDRRPLWGQTVPQHAKLCIEALSIEDSRRLVEAILRKAPDVPSELVELIVRRAEGNPFCIEEMIKMLIESKVIIPDPAQWRIQTRRIPAVSIPPTLTGVLQARLDGLSVVERGLLQRAAVVGRTFWDLALISMTGASDSRPMAALTPEAVRDGLALLRRRELILFRDTSAFAGAAEFSFKHELLREVTYGTLLKGVRRHYHSQAAVWLVRNAGERVMEFAGAVGAHYEQAGMNAEAADWYGRAGQQARLGYSPASAIDSLQKALQLLPDSLPEDKGALRKRFEWQLALCEALGAQARSTEAMAAAQAALVTAEELGDLVAQAGVWNELAFLQERLGANHESVNCANRALALVCKADGGNIISAELVRAMHLKGWALYRLGDSRAVLDIANETLNLCRQRADRRGMATSFKLFGVAQLQLGKVGEAENYFSQGLALAQELDDRRTIAAMWSNLGEAARLRGDYQSAADLYERALAIAREIGHRESEIIYLSNVGGARLGLRQYNEAETDLRRAVALSSDSVRCSLAETYVFLSAACRHQGKFTEAWFAAEQALLLAERSDNFLDMGAAWRALGQAAVGVQGAKTLPPTQAAGSEPAAFFEESLRVYQQIAAAGELVRTLEDWAAYESRRGRPEQSRALLEQARTISSRLGLQPRLPSMERQPSGALDQGRVGQP